MSEQINLGIIDNLLDALKENYQPHDSALYETLAPEELYRHMPEELQEVHRKCIIKSRVFFPIQAVLNVNAEFQELRDKGLGLDTNDKFKHRLEKEIKNIEEDRDRNPALAEAQIQQIGRFSRFYKEMTGVDLGLDIAPEGIDNKEASRVQSKKINR